MTRKSVHSRQQIVAILLLLTVVFGCSSKRTSVPESVLADKIRGGWAGQIIGCAYGGPTEFKYFGMIPDSVTIRWNGDEVRWYFDNMVGMYDDVYMDLSFLATLDRYGFSAPADSFAVSFARAGYPLWHANQAARRNILDGLLPPQTGFWKNNPHSDDIDFQIESDFAGLVSPGRPDVAAEICEKVGHIMCSGDGWYGGLFVATMYSLSFVCDTPLEIVRGALSALPEGTRYHEAVATVLSQYEENQEDWKEAWRLVNESFGEDVGCPRGVLDGYDIDAVLNGAYVAIGLLYGEGDFGRSIEIATRCGQDSDCNPSTVGGILGTLQGFNAIPPLWRDALDGCGDLEFPYTGISFEKACLITEMLARETIDNHGGRMSKKRVLSWRKTSPKPAPFEQNFSKLRYNGKLQIRRNLEWGQEDSISFEGSGLVLRYSFGGKTDALQDYSAEVEVSLDSEAPDTVFLPAAFERRRPELFFRYNLTDGDHILRIRWLNPVPELDVKLGDLILYKKDET